MLVTGGGGTALWCQRVEPFVLEAEDMAELMDRVLLEAVVRVDLQCSCCVVLDASTASSPWRESHSALHLGVAAIAYRPFGVRAAVRRGVRCLGVEGQRHVVLVRVARRAARSPTDEANRRILFPTDPEGVANVTDHDVE